VAKVEAATHGERNETLNKAAFSLGQLVEAGHLNEGEVIGRLYEAAMVNELAEDDGPRAVMDTIHSGLRGGSEHPREIPGRAGSVSESRSEATWSDPVELPSGLKPVAPYDSNFLPRAITPWVLDIADRMQCPPDFVAVSALVALGATIGRKIGIRPQIRTDWLEVPNLWGCIVGRPGAMKSPAMMEALKPLHRLEFEAHAENKVELKAYNHSREVYELRKHDAQAKAKASLKKGTEIDFPQVDEPEVPTARRYIVNDVTYEALGQILADNPNGVLAYRDEMVSMLKSLDREEWAAARGFFLSAWDGKGGYTFDRITRGKTRIDAACLSMLGSTQPGRIAEYIRRAITGGAGDDGLIQRFGLLVWPNQDPNWVEADRFPDTKAREKAWSTFTRLAELTPEAVKAETDQFGTIPFLRLDEVARGLFAEWHRDHELRLRSGTLHPALESHLSKYRKLVPALALINHLSDGNAGPVNDVAVLRAIAMSRYLESHAVRLYAAGTEAETTAAKAILGHIRRGDLTDAFTARDVHQHGWSNLTDKDQVRAGLALLEEYDWIAGVSVETGGRPRIVYRINPRGAS
jgi:hypothetical protein